VCTGSRVQFPLCLARATTSHKTQGATLERSAVMLNECFEVGQPYVMLSRVRRLEDLVVLNHRFGLKQFQERAARVACEYQDSLVAPGSLAAIIGAQ
jgi:ATP-dependent exoDNAse (exonuclease V) alpha subunit